MKLTYVQQSWGLLALLEIDFKCQGKSALSPKVPDCKTRSLTASLSACKGSHCVRVCVRARDIQSMVKGCVAVA